MHTGTSASIHRTLRAYGVLCLPLALAPFSEEHESYVGTRETGVESPDSVPERKLLVSRTFQSADESVRLVHRAAGQSRRRYLTALALRIESREEIDSMTDLDESERMFLLRRHRIFHPHD